ncbi:ParB/RepB/Spo0J family partition protein [Salmonella enterica subsp. enterica serovar Typhimurium]|uniref:ParB/RepB/Spo0J family partition protein n=1 Tax=Escherichia coli TaxID=562 RepID=UPI00127DB2CC|nr:ParB/RepB/Spo0J family partition protein [Escherichia coli]EBA5214735.1 ParB/RepB/Spo0J family partition protein [Salmonella enterica]ECG4155348.1 ParB/RepB/Spo0J family partition protein [Salmonella enterica subsp. enterica serovar Heidelberg]ECG4614110.1 ParB/RepB/Spo0J family partition protein [Salmonella enterica subsp. enterica serovar Typhimurium]EFZ6888291.1 ParB/RepB/Spo0J family partition protein [Shigella sonnei]EGT2823253.1 ParB/RepB/Spo0J family partition protein [Salmonella ent
MPVTKCEPETTRKASRKSVKTQETVLSALLAQTAEVSVPLASLIKSPLNVRTVPYSAESVSELADSIKGVGLLQNLVVHALPGDRHGVAAGGRRLAALNMLAERNILPADWPVRVKVIPQELATAASMTENGHRRDMHPAEQIAGFRAMAQEGKTPAQIGDLLGYSPRHVQRMLKLADLAPVILDALAEDRITTEHCQALALENDTARQVQVFEAACQSGWGGKPEVQTIRRLVTESEVAVAGNSKFRFVGADAFSPDELRTDLFSDDEGGYVDCVALDAALLEKLQAVAEHLREAEGWEWCAGRMEPVGECREDAGTYRCLPEPEAVLTEAEEERLNELMTRYDALENQCEESDLLEAEMKLMRCMAKVRAWTPEMRAGGGVVVSWRYGNVCVQRGVQLRSEDDAADDADRTEQMQEKASVEEISLPLLTKMSSERTLAVQAALMQQPDKSLALLAWTLCLNVFGSGAYSKPAQISLECEHYSLTSDAPSGKEGAAFMALMAEKARLAALLPEGWSRDMTTFLSLSQEVLLSLLSFCTACSLNGVQTRECGHTSRSPLDSLETAIGFHMRDWWQPTKANFFGHLKKPQIIAALNEAGLSGAARDAEKMKKGDAAEHAEFHMKDNRWVPGWMCAPRPQMDATEHTTNLADAA